MSDHTIVNLREVEDMAPRFGLSPGLESRFARKALGMTTAGLSLFRIAPDFQVPFGHRHADQEEVYLVLSGSVLVKLGDADPVELGEWDAIRVAPTVVRGLRGGPRGAEVLAFGAPSDDNADAEMVKEFWTD